MYSRFMSLCFQSAHKINQALALSTYRRHTDIWAEDYAKANSLSSRGDYEAHARFRWTAYVHVLECLYADNGNNPANVLRFKPMTADLLSFPDMIGRIDAYFTHLTRLSPFELMLAVSRKLNKSDSLTPAAMLRAPYANPYDVGYSVLRLVSPSPLLAKLKVEESEFNNVKFHDNIHAFPCVCRIGISPSLLDEVSYLPCLIPGCLRAFVHGVCGLGDHTFVFAFNSHEESKLWFYQEPVPDPVFPTDEYKVFVNTAFHPSASQREIPVSSSSSSSSSSTPARADPAFSTPAPKNKDPVAPGAPKRKRSASPHPLRSLSPEYLPSPIPGRKRADSPVDSDPFSTPAREAKEPVAPGAPKRKPIVPPRSPSPQYMPSPVHSPRSPSPDYSAAVPQELVETDEYDSDTSEGASAPVEKARKIDTELVETDEYDSDTSEGASAPVEKAHKTDDTKLGAPAKSASTVSTRLTVAAKAPRHSAPAALPRFRARVLCSAAPSSSSSSSSSSAPVKVPRKNAPARAVVSSGSPPKERARRPFQWEMIVSAFRPAKGRTLFLVKWDDHPWSECSFEPTTAFFPLNGPESSFETTFLFNLFREFDYKYLSTDMCRSPSGFQPGPAVPQLCPGVNIMDLRDFYFSYAEDGDVHCSVLSPTQFRTPFHGWRHEIKRCMPKRKFVFKDQDKDLKEDPDYVPSSKIDVDKRGKGEAKSL